MISTGVSLLLEFASSGRDLHLDSIFHFFYIHLDFDKATSPLLTEGYATSSTSSPTCGLPGARVVRYSARNVRTKAGAHCLESMPITEADPCKCLFSQDDHPPITLTQLFTEPSTLLTNFWANGPRSVMEPSLPSPSPSQATSTSYGLTDQSEAIPTIPCTASVGDRESTDPGMKVLTRGVQRQATDHGFGEPDRSECCLLL
jgi:hypothetical protein